MTASKFQVGDRVYSPFHDCGTVTKIIQNEAYPIEVTWDVSRYKHEKDVSTFTPDGFLWLGDKRDYTQITVVGKAAEDRHKFKVGDRVSFPYHVLGTVIAKHDDERDYPIKVKWDKSTNGREFSTFTPDGFLAESHLEDADRLTVVGRSMPEEKEEEEEVGQIAYSAINPSHYRVEGIPEAIEIMKHLMTKEQMEGFLWGNILKYAYRYGRKGDKAETAGKIAWYATKLKELEECESK